MSSYHISVMPKESIGFLQIKKNHWYIDCNLGGGGHTKLILEAGGNVLGIDLDSDAIDEVKKNLKEFIDEGRLKLSQANFLNLDQAAKEHNLTKISGVFFDLGVSSHQLEEAERGFSFNADAPLDMRMNKSQSLSAKELVNGLYEKELAELFLKLGEENFARPIAKKIVAYREKKIIESTNELAQIILSARRRSPSDRTHPATRVFQALRIAVNDELNSLKEALPKAFEVLEIGGRVVVLSFHSLEDRIVKNYFKELSSHSRARPESSRGEGGNPSDQPMAKILTDKPIETSDEESLQNPRARSAKLRAIEKLTN